MLITLIQQAAPSAGGSIMNSLLLFGPLILIFYFLILRPQSQQAKKHKAMVSELQRGDEIITRGGLIGKIKKVNDDELIICLLYTSPSPRDLSTSRMPSSA